MSLLQTVCFSLVMASNCIWYCGTPHERVASQKDFDRKMDIRYQFVKDGGKIQYSHNV